MGNIRPSYRSTLKAIQLVSIFKVQDLQEVGINEMLGPFMDDLKLLEQVYYDKIVVEMHSPIVLLLMHI